MGGRHAADESSRRKVLVSFLMLFCDSLSSWDVQLQHGVGLVKDDCVVVSRRDPDP